MTDLATAPAIRDSLPSPGDCVRDEYRVERLLGRGGMGAVFAAVRVDSGQRVALKVMLGDERQPASARRFTREARALGAIDNPHVAKLLDFGRLDDGSPFMVLELLEGQTLDELIRDAAPLPIDEAVDYLLQACEGVAAAHAHGIVHRDLKPSNLFQTVTAAGATHLKVLDFGISKSTAGFDLQFDSTSLTKSNSLLGSPQYMSPEQVRSAKDVDVRCDIWALGLILHKLLTGKPAFGAASIGEHFAMVLSSPPTKLRAQRPEAPEMLERVIVTCLRRDPEGRFQDVGQLANAIAEFAPQGGLERAERIVAVLKRAGAASSSRPSLLPPDDQPSDSVYSTIAATLDRPLAPLGGASLSETARETPHTRRGRGRKRVLGIALVVTAGVLLAMSLTQRRERSVAVHDMTRQPAAASAAPAQRSVPTPVAGASMTIRLHVTPPDAEARLDGAPVDAAKPLHLPRSNREHRLTIVAADHLPWSRSFAATDDIVFDISLVPARTRAVARASTPQIARAATAKPTPSSKHTKDARVDDQAPPAPSGSAPPREALGPLVDHL